MSGLVEYGSSDEEDDIQPEKPAKIAKTEAHGKATTARGAYGMLSYNQDSKYREINRSQVHQRPAATTTLNSGPPPASEDPTRPLKNSSPAPGPSIPADDLPSTANTPASAPLSPYTFSRQRIQELTMPTVPNFSIPTSPPPPPTNSEAAASLASTTKKFERFLELKAQGVHFNERLQKSSSLRNPTLLPKLMDFAGISPEESHESSLPEGFGVPVKWGEECYVESLVKENERKEKKRKEGRERMEFVVEKTKSAGSSKSGTPKSGTEGRRSRFDKR